MTTEIFEKHGWKMSGYQNNHKGFIHKDFSLENDSFVLPHGNWSKNKITPNGLKNG